MTEPPAGERFEEWLNSPDFGDRMPSYLEAYRAGWQAAHPSEETIEAVARKVQDKISQVTMPTTKEIEEILREELGGGK